MISAVHDIFIVPLFSRTVAWPYLKTALSHVKTEQVLFLASLHDHPCRVGHKYGKKRSSYYGKNEV